MGRWTRLLLLGSALAASVLSATGCHRGHYRRQADREVYGLESCGAVKTDATSDDFSIQPSPQSRMYDPNCPDWEPMPPDDPVSHRLMQCVDNKKGWPYWRVYGNTPYVENPDWMQYLPYDQTGKVVLDRPTAVQLSLLNSREYQTQLENLYLSALDVTLQRFRFDAQFFGGNTTFFTADGPARAGSSSSLLEVDNNLEMRKLFATGGELVVGVANSLVWQFAGPNQYNANTLLDFSLVQPLLRAGGRAVVLEGLTEAERTLLANIRQMERYRRGFYTQIVVGRSPGPGPTLGGIRIGTTITVANQSAAGYLGLLEDQVQIKNQRANMLGLRESLRRLEEFYDVGRISATQVGLTRQQLYAAQSRLLQITTDYESTLETYKITLGLPPDIDMRIEDQLLDRFDLIDSAMTETQTKVTDLLIRLRDPQQLVEFCAARESAATLADLRQDVTGKRQMVAEDLATLEKALPERRKSLRLLLVREEFRSGEIDRSIGDIAALDLRVSTLKTDFATVSEKLRVEMDQLEQAWQAAAPKAQAAAAAGADAEAADASDAACAEVRKLADMLSAGLSTLSVVQARARLDTVTLTPVDATPKAALQVARLNRQDWMNARAALVDQWRQIEIAANDLESDLDVTFSGDINTTDNNPVRFRGTTGRLRVGLEFDAPLTRLAERNAYRATLIAYQRARRDFYAYEDRVAEGLRDTIRRIRLNQLNFEVQRAAVFVAIARVDQSQEELRVPPKVVGTMKLGTTTARDLVDALSALLGAQNNFLDVWVSQEVLRLNLEFDLGTMRLDQNGMWIDPGPIGPEYLRSYGACDTPTPDAPEDAPLPLPKLEEIPAPAGEPIPLEPSLPDTLPPEPSLPETLPPEPADKP